MKSVPLPFGFAVQSRPGWFFPIVLDRSRWCSAARPIIYKKDEGRVGMRKEMDRMAQELQKSKEPAAARLRVGRLWQRRTPPGRGESPPPRPEGAYVSQGSKVFFPVSVRDRKRPVARRSNITTSRRSLRRRCWFYPAPHAPGACSARRRDAISAPSCR